MDLGQIDMLGKGELRAEADMGWRRFGVLLLAVAAVGLPVNHAAVYALLVAAAVLIFTGAVTARATAWLAALVIVAAAIAAHWWLTPPRIDEGHNAFLPGPVLEKALPADVYRRMAEQFAALYPAAVNCKPGSAVCARGSQPDRAYAFSGDGIFHASDLSRAVTALDFSDPVWLRLGFVNERRYDWSYAPGLHRLDRDRRFYMGLHRWHLAMPWFEVIRLRAAYAGGELCWRGEVMWEGGDGRFAAPAGPCRTITADDAGRHVFGLAVKPDTLAMHLAPPWPLRLLRLASAVVPLAAVIALLLALVRIDVRRAVLPLLLIGLSVAVIAADDASFLGGLRPFDGGDDGLFYDGVGRGILQKLLAGDVRGFLQGGENVFYYGGPGLRYFRALEHVVFGESCLGYLSLVLLLPIVTYRLLRRFLPGAWAVAGAIVFTAIPIGGAFGTTFFQYAQWAARGFADPAAYILFVAGLLVLVTANEKFAAPFFAALLLALAIFMKPIVAPAAAVLLGGAGLAALYSRQWPRLAGLCIGFLPVLSMALHNWVFGHALVLFSANADNPLVLVMPASAYAAALREIAGGGPHLARAAMQIVDWLSGPAQLYAAIPLDAAAVAVLVYVAAARFEPWLRLTAGAALAQHAVALFYTAAVARYHFLAWFLTMVVVLVWLREVAVPLLRRRYPALCGRLAAHPAACRLASGLAALHKVSA